MKKQDHNGESIDSSSGIIMNESAGFSGCPADSGCLRKKWNDMCLQLGIPSLSVDTSARLMAILMHFGNNESFVLSPNFRADCEYIQKRYHINGGETPSVDFVANLQFYSKQVENLAEPPLWAKKLFKDMYDINI